MKRIPLLIIVLLSTLVCYAGPKRKANKDTQHFRYEIECAGTGVQGSYVIKVWSFSKSKKVATEQCKKNAVHGVLFKGFPGKNGCVSQRAIIANPGVEFEMRDYFNHFFENGGEYMKYVTVTEGSTEIQKIKRGDYKIGMIVTVSKDALRKAMESAGVVKSLSFGF